MPFDTTFPLLAYRCETQVRVDGYAPLPLTSLDNGLLELAPPQEADPDLARAIAFAAFEALSNHGDEVAIRLTAPGWEHLLPDLLRSGAAISIHGVPTVLPAAFWQLPDRWLPVQPRPYPAIWRPGPHGRHPLRPPMPQGLLYHRYIPWLDGWFTMRAATLEDLPVFHRWQNDPRVAEFFEEAGTLEQHQAHLSSLIADPHILPVIGSIDGRDFAYFELYWARENRIGAHYDAGAWDRGWHVLIGEEDTRGANYVTAWMPSLMHYMFLAEPRLGAIMGEPKTSHHKQLKNLGRCGFAHIREFDFSHKRASLVRLERQHFFEARIWARYQPGDGRPLSLSLTRLMENGVSR